MLSIDQTFFFSLCLVSILLYEYIKLIHLDCFDWAELLRNQIKFYFGDRQYIERIVFISSIVMFTWMTSGEKFFSFIQNNEENFICQLEISLISFEKGERQREKKEADRMIDLMKLRIYP